MRLGGALLSRVLSRSCIPLVIEVTAPLSRRVEPPFSSDGRGVAATLAGSPTSGGGMKLEALRRLAGSGLALELEAVGQGDRLSADDGWSKQSREKARGPNGRTRRIAEQVDERRGCGRQNAGAEVVFVGDALVVEREDVGKIGEPLDHHDGEVDHRGIGVDAAAGVPGGERDLGRERGQQGRAEAVEVARAKDNLLQAGKIRDGGWSG